MTSDKIIGTRQLIGLIIKQSLFSSTYRVYIHTQKYFLYLFPVFPVFRKPSRVLLIFV